MILLTAFLIFLGILSQNFFFEISYFSGGAHNLCLGLAPPSQHRIYYQALVCGASLHQEASSFSLKSIGLFHLFVVSGAHLVFLQRMLKWVLPEKYFNVLFGLISFVLVICCQMKTPVLRAWLYYVVRQANQSFHLTIHKIPLHLMTVVFCLSLNPQAIHSSSLILSWLACLGLSQSKNPLTQSLIIYCLSYPIIQSLQPLSVAALIPQLLMAPMIGWVLFPLTLACFILPFLTVVADPLWSAFFSLCQWSESQLPTSHLTFPPLSHTVLWLYALTISSTLTIFKRSP